MRTDLPASQVQEAMKLQARGLVELYRLDMHPPGGSIFSLYISPLKQVTWQGHTWFDDTPCFVAESGQNVAGDSSRPKFSIVNPNGVWSRYVHQGYANNATVRRYRILTTDLAADNNAFQLSSWRVSKVVNVNKDIVVLELRGVLDGANFWIPSETYRPPKYPAVSVQ